MNKLLPVIIAATLLLAGCSTSNKFASSFGKRRYNKGFYKDVAEGIKIAAANKTTARAIDVKPAEVKPHVVKQVVMQKAEEPVAIANKPVNAISKPASTPIAKANERSTLPVAENSAIADAILSHHLADEQSTTSYSTTSAILFLAACLTFLLCLIFLFAEWSIEAAVVFVFVGVLGSVLLDILAIIFALIALSHSEANLTWAYIVLAVNAGLLVIYAISATGRI